MTPSYREHHTIRGDEQHRYLTRLDAALEVLVRALAGGSSHHQQQALQAFGQQYGWERDRLPKQDTTYRTFSKLVERVRNEYRWFDWITDSPDPTRNQGNFDEIGISTISGLPWGSSFADLKRMQGTATERLESLSPYVLLSQHLAELLTGDTFTPERVGEEVTNLHKVALRRNFLEQLGAAQLIGYETPAPTHAIQATRQQVFGGEELWSIAILQYNFANGIFETYLIDLWQDIRDPQIVATPSGVGALSPALANTFRFSSDNAAWFILQTIDVRFESLHPVHASHALIGPYENRYRTKPEPLPPLAIVPELLGEDPEATVLRFNRQYSYAPNHRETPEGKLRQILHRENWSDEFIICPSKFASRVSKSVEGSQTRVLEI